MKQHSFEKLLQQDAPPPDPAARLAARRAALAEFAKANPPVEIAPAPERRGVFQALLGALRLSRDNDHGSDSMPLFSRKAYFGAAASVCLAIVGSTVVWKTFQQDPSVGQLSARSDVPAARSAEVVSSEASSSKADAAETAVAGPESSAPAEDARLADAQARRDQDKLAEKRAADEKKAEELMARMQAIPEPEDPVIEQYQEQPIETPAAAGASAAAPALAKSGADNAAGAKEKDAETQEVVVTGTRGSLQASMETKRDAVGEIQEVVVTSADRKPATPHKGVAPPARTARNRSSGDSYSYEPPPAPPPAQITSGRIGTKIEPTSVRPQPEGNDKFEHFEVNSIKQPAIEAERVSTFSADVDTSSYSFVRKQLEQGHLPQKDAVRAEEMINYFDYAWPAADSREQPFRPTIVVSDSPWGKGRKLIHIGIKGYEIPANKRPDANIVMLLDVSGSMNQPDKLPLVKQSMKLLLGSLKPTDTVGIVVYAGAAGMVLPPTPVGEKERITSALDSLTPGGSTAGAAGIELAYQLAENSFRKEGLNRILLCTDGDFNVGIAGTEELKGFVERKREKGVYLSVLGFGQGNYRDELAQALAQNGNGVAAYIDSVSEAQKVLVQQAGASLFTIAKDVKFQVEFNPATVAEYRQIGYETRALKQEDFNNDKVDAGDVGAGHTVTAIYEITPVGEKARMIEKSRYVKQPEVTGNMAEYGHLKMRYKLPGQDTSTLIEQPIAVDSGRASETIQRDVGFSTAVAGFAQLLRGGQYTGSLGYDDIIKQALATRGEDAFGYRSEFVQLVRKADAAK